MRKFMTVGATLIALSCLTVAAQAGDTLTGVAIGAGSGAVVAGPVGAVVGGVVGAVVGGPRLPHPLMHCWHDRHHHRHCH